MSFEFFLIIGYEQAYKSKCSGITQWSKKLAKLLTDNLELKKWKLTQ